MSRRCRRSVVIMMLLAVAKFQGSCIAGVGAVGIQHTHAAMGMYTPKAQGGTVAAAGGAHESIDWDQLESSWYKRYPAYPEYCSIPESMAARAIPPLKTDYRVGDTRLVHVTSVIRHGARTPYAGDLECWDGYRESQDTGIWNCNLTTFLAPPLVATGNNDVMFMFEKKYDALLPPLTNELNGTCQVGQLLLRGYDQEVQNGQHLRNAYTFDGSNMQHDVRMRLLDLSSSNADAIPPYELLKYRSDDDQRTLMSGQVLLRGLFGDEFVAQASKQLGGTHAIIPLHTADRDEDILSPSTYMCNRLKDLRAQAEASHEYKQLSKSEENERLTKFIKKELGADPEEFEAIDCIMTTICTDRPLPQAIDDYGRGENSNASKYHDEYGDNLLQRLVDQDVKYWAFHVTYNDGAYAKLAMGPLWAEILANIQPILDGNADDRGPPSNNKLALFSGHDTTLLPLLVSLGPRVWDGEWPPYASMLIIEIHEFIDGKTDRTVFQSDYSFRLLMNGRVLTSKLDGCPPDSDLCDVQVLLDRITPFATADRDCDSRIKRHPVLQESAVLLSTRGGVALVLFVTIASGLVGSAFTWLYMTRRLPLCCRKARSTYELGMAIPASSDNGMSRYHDRPVENFQDEFDADDNGDVEDNVQLQTITALVE